MSNRPFHWAWVTLATCFVNIFINYSIRLGYGILLPEMIRALDITRTQGGMIYNSYLITYITLSPLTGNLTDRIGAKTVITFFCLLLTAGTSLMGTVRQFWSACLFFAIVGAGAAAMWTPVVALVQRWFGTRRRGMALGILSTGYGLGFATMGGLFPLIVETYSWRYCWFLLGAAAGVMVLVNGLLLRSNPEDHAMAPWGEDPNPVPTQPVQEVSFPYRLILKTTRFWLIGMSYCFIAAALYIITTFMVDYAHQELGIAYDMAALLATVHGLSQVGGVLTIPAISDYVGRRYTLITSNTVVACTFVGIIAVGANTSWLFVIIGIVGVCYGITFPIYGACAGDYFPKEVIGTVLGAWTTCYGLGAIGGLIVAGRIRDVTQSFGWAFFIAVACAGIAAVLIFLVRDQTTHDLAVQR